MSTERAFQSSASAKRDSTRAAGTSPRAACSAVALLVLAAGCGSGGGTSTGDRVPFIAFASDFAGFRSWQSNSVDNPVASGSTHVSGPRTVYINQLPAADATEFPIGTLIVKETFTDGKIFARAKRGGNFNATGAVNWEWFELQETSTNEIVIQWHGFGPPAGADMYGGDANGACNDCHVIAKANDYVLAPWLALGGNLAGIPQVPTDAGGVFATPDGAADGGAATDGP